MGATLLRNGSLQITNVQKEHEGFYTIGVQADQLLQATTSLSLQPNPVNEGLGGGAIAGIVIGVFAAVAAVIGIAVYSNNKKNSPGEN